MVQSTAFTEKTDGQTPKALTRAKHFALGFSAFVAIAEKEHSEAALNAEGFERAKHFEPLRSSFTRAKHFKGVRGV